jgi:hypothetical protein
MTKDKYNETLNYNKMNTERIEQIQKETAYPDSISVQQALLKVWNECEQEKVVNKNDLLPDVSNRRELFDKFLCDLTTKEIEQIIDWYRDDIEDSFFGGEGYTKEELKTIFANNFDCYADTNDESVVMAMTEERYIEVLRELKILPIQDVSVAKRKVCVLWGDKKRQCVLHPHGCKECPDWRTQT